MPCVLPETDAILSQPTPHSSVSTDTDSESGAAAMVEALDVPRNVRLGFGFGLVFTVAVFAFFVVIPGTNRSQLYYLALAFVLAVGVGGITTMVLTARSAYRLSKDL